MMSNLSFLPIYRDLYRLIETRRKFQLLAILILIISTVFAEFGLVLLIGPLMNAVIDNGQSLVSGILLLTPDSGSSIFFWFIFFIVLVTAAKIVTQYSISLWSHLIAHDFGKAIVDHFLKQPYEIKLRAQKAEYLAVLGTKLNVMAGSVLTPALQMLASFAPVLGIFFAFLVVAPAATLAGSVFLGVLYVAVALSVRKTLGANSQKISEGSNTVMHTLRGFLDRPRATSLDPRTHQYFIRYSVADDELKRALAKNILITHIPRFAVEGALLVAIVVVVYFSLDFNSLMENVGELSVFALGLQRGLPMLQRLYIGYTALKGNMHSAKHILDVLRTPGAKANVLKERKTTVSSITTKDLQIKLEGWTSPISVPDIRFEAGNSYVIVAPSGFGKTILVEHLIGLREPSSGSVLVDSRPLGYGELFGQVAFMSNDEPVEDSTVEEFVGVMPRDIDGRDLLFQKLGLDDLFTERKISDIRLGSSNTFISLGQLQRLKIVKVILANKPVTILDEPTSNLDADSAKRVVSTIVEMSSASNILIVISHDEIWPSHSFEIIRMSS